MNRASTQLNLVHGWGPGRAIWMPLLGYLGGWGEVCSLDLPGYGKRSSPGADLDAWADALAGDADTGAVWVGSSLGGLVAAAVADRHPDKVAGLITIGCTPCFIQRADWPHGMPAAEFGDFESKLHADPDAALSRFLHLATSGSATARDDLRQLRAIPLGKDSSCKPALQEGLELLKHTDARSRWRKLECPCLHLIPEQDALVPASILTFHQHSPPSQQTGLLGSASHLPWLGRPRQIADLINAWEAPFTS